MKDTHTQEPTENYFICLDNHGSLFVKEYNIQFSFDLLKGKPGKLNWIEVN